jgi:hypothetical protein
MDDQKEPLQQSTKIDPITAVQDSIDSLALSLFEALRGVRDAVAPESLETGGAAAAAANKSHNVGQFTVAFKEAEELADNATAEERLLNGLNVDYFPPRAFDLLEPDYDAFLLAYLSGNVHAKELVDRYMKMEAWEKREDGVVPSTSSKSNNDAAATNNNNNNTNNNVEIGDVGYEFRKQFDSGWYTGKVTEILLTVVGNTSDRRCVYNDGDVEDLSLEELQRLAKLDPNSKFYAKKPKISIKLKAKQTSQDKDDEDGGDDKEESTTASKVRIPLTQEEYTQFLIDSEQQRDIQTTQHLAQEILNKSAEVDNLVATLPGMDRTRDMQMKRIEELLERNHQVAKELDEAHVLAKKRLEEVRKVLGETTCLALGVEEE